MGSSETGGVVDCSVGSIVWVRRRNGSWWPGKILGPEELSSSHVTSPRSGTPVKLLGREDASVDWYNLEKSKRVKAFRCGEFDDCIERAEAAQGMPPKKREKYARREDAILHALELERQLVEKKYGKSGNSSNGRTKSPDAVTSLECMENGGGSQKDSRSDQLHEKLDSSVVEKNGTDQQPCLVTVKEENQPSGDDDSAGALPRMRGLQDFGLRTTPLTREEHSAIASRTKRSRNSYLAYDSGDCSNDNQTLTTQIEIPVSKLEESSYRADVGDNHNSGSTEDTETDCSETDSMESDSDEEMAALSDGSASIELHPKYPRSIEAQDEHGSSSDDFDEMAYADGLSPHPPHGCGSNSTAMSKWQLKGKRNNRNIGKRHPDRFEADIPRVYANSRNSNWSSGGFKADPIGKSFTNHVPRHGSTGLHEAADFDGLGWSNQPIMREYWEDPQDYVDPFPISRHHFGNRIMLIDVDTKVQANNYRRDVPMISLMSKLNGHAIVGHPIQIEALESGLSDNHVYATDCFHTEPETPALTSVWRTGRRTANARVPRPYPMERILLRNSPKKSSPLSNQKIRSLSSIASDEQHPRNGGNYQLIKTGNLPTTVACIPVNLVFSRLNEELVSRHQ